MSVISSLLVDYDTSTLKPYYFISKKATEKSREKRYSAVTLGKVSSASNRHMRPRSTRRERTDELIELNLDKTDVIHEATQAFKLTKVG